LKVSSGTVAGMALSQPTPVYPPIAKAAHVQGVVVLHAIISKQGTIENLSVISGPPMLTTSAVDAVRRWRYRPYLLNGDPVEVETTINVNFTFGGG
jgi:protein TonB